MKTIPFQPLDPALYREIVRRALAEDLGWGDVTTEATVPPRRCAPAASSSRNAPCVIAGLDVAAEVFAQLDPGCAFDRASQGRRSLPARRRHRRASRPGGARC